MSNPIPEVLRPAVDRALRAAFGTAELDSATPLSGGLSGAGLWRIRVGGIPYVLKIEAGQHAVIDPARSYACMRIAAQACLAPRVRYAEPADGVAVIDHVTPVPLQEYPAAGHALIVELAQSARLLHQTPAFPPLADYLDGLNDMVGQFLALDVLETLATGELFARFADLRGAYRTRPGDLVSSHNDLNPGNVVYDGRRLWLVDWDAAFLADRYVDLATLANWFTRDAAGEEKLLTTYFRRSPEPQERARFEVMRLVNHVFTGVIFLATAAAERPGESLADRTLAGPSLPDLHERLRTGRFAMLEWENRVTYGKARLAAALEGLRAPKFAAALTQLAAGPQG
ncbi:phosphotransferase [Phenylobacterium sp.]|uniref:phosphotransferase n=1 Tax=Phenylobacterium sp. TaxID=1871053 RepID=UPI002B85E4A8|nr:phosphotransferase [Phenylobacterium sp.]HLZ75223.1 phosphotransferase [Phenylobacterium sp.]